MHEILILLILMYYKLFYFWLSFICKYTIQPLAAHVFILLKGVMNDPLKFLTACKILPLLDLLAKFKGVLAFSCSQRFLQLLACLLSSQYCSKFC